MMKKVNQVLLGHHRIFRMSRQCYVSLLLLFVMGHVYAQTNQVSGTVTDSHGEPLIGVSVLQKETTNGTVTDFDGNFQLTVPQGAILSFSYIGYGTKEVTVGNQSHITVKLDEDTQKLDEVIVVGYGVQKKSVVTGAISSIKSEDMYTSVTNPEQALQGKTSGVQVISSSGSPGAAMKIRIRGYSSNGSSDPLYIVDGLRTTDISGLDPNNIASMEVLKDAASAAIYGAEGGGNGVVLISTKPVHRDPRRLPMISSIVSSLPLIFLN